MLPFLTIELVLKIKRSKKEYQTNIAMRSCEAMFYHGVIHDKPTL
jgi:hypothetical protein